MNYSSLILWVVSALLLLSCEQEVSETEYLPSENYNYTKVDFDVLEKRQKIYVPIYSDIYVFSGSKRFPLTATLSIRNTSFTDTMYVGKVDYYDSEGNMTKAYLDEPIYMSPLTSVEFVVRSNENIGGAGANFIVDWGAKSRTKNPVIQAVMIGESNQQGISFVTNGIVIEEHNNGSGE
ncbi:MULTISPECIES: DUF3124 domain-containing protein [Gracilimonas]|uniref:DUF3124 domain-containing protein n=1 Tax=Gracilimonas sediminicola TaxID=2952158 RepID=A0A9X2RG51_9BACT|nr:DUF3124 domain-containing protein [Gracilimonas sediminicola]MCP9291313.1 DUF3124 domain-containing protein [Gracilimonas sediminicola]